MVKRGILMNEFTRNVMFLSLLFCFFSVPVFADSIGGTFKAGNQYDINSIMIKGSINDYAEIISVNDKEEIQSALTELIDDDSFSVIIVTVGNLQGKNIDRFAKELLEKKFGNIPSDTILYVFSLDDRKYTFYLGGSVAGKISKDIFGYIGRDSAESFFSRGEYSKGVLNVVNKLHDTILNGINVDIPEESEVKSGLSAATISFFRWGIIIFSVFLVLLILVANILSFKKASYGKNLSTISEHKDDEYFSAANLASTLFARELEKSGNYKKGI